MKTGHIVLGIIAGLSTGALIGILFAPERGAVTRKRIFGKTDNYKDTLRVEFEHLVNDILNNCGCSRLEAEEWVANGKTLKDVGKDDLPSKS